MMRFIMPENLSDASQKAKAVLAQLEELLHSEALREILGILDVDTHTLERAYNKRAGANGTVVELQGLDSSVSLEEKREVLYPLFRELGFIDINKPVKNNHSRIIVLGGSLNACNERTECAKNWIDETTVYVDGLACYRPIGSAERKNAGFSLCDTEFGAMSENFVRVFNLDGREFTEDFKSNRNLNSVSCVRNYGKSDNREYRIYAAPSSEPHLRRADTADTLSFYYDCEGQIGAGDSALFVTNNRHCNRQFLQLAYCMIKGGYGGTIDVIGCYSDENVTSVDKYDPLLYLQDLIGIIDWMERFKTLV